MIMALSFPGHAKGFEPMEEALVALKTDTLVQVDEIEVLHWGLANTFYLFSATKKQSNKGLIFYPGANVDARSYAPLARSMALSGVAVALVVGVTAIMQM